MTKNSIALIMILLLMSCSTDKSKPIESQSITTIGGQKLVSNFLRKGIKLEWECSFLTLNSNCYKGELKAVEVTSYATSNGNSEANREDAFKVAEIKAKVQLRKFIQEDISSSEVTNTLSKNIEKANDKIKNKIVSNEDVSVSDEEASKGANIALRENSNEIVRTITETIKVQSQGILKGIKIIDQKIVDAQTVQVTIRWDKESDKASDSLRNIFK
jgi:uncharacterized protein with von Willebrand factor type A (vWA) domain